MIQAGCGDGCISLLRQGNVARWTAMADCSLIREVDKQLIELLIFFWLPMGYFDDFFGSAVKLSKSEGFFSSPEPTQASRVVGRILKVKNKYSRSIHDDLLSKRKKLQQLQLSEKNKKSAIF
jgi:hypothetical protein